MVTLKGIVRYDGTNFAGWQRQPHARTVQGEIEAALSRIAGDIPVRVQGASRTDAGVHAFGQVFSFEWPEEPPQRMRHALSKMLAPEIRILSLDCAIEGFNARFSARGKRYAYSIDLGKEPEPFLARYAWHVHHPLDLGLLESLLPRLCGTRDFGGFKSAGSTPQENTTRKLWSVRLVNRALIGPADAAPSLRLEFYGDAFLYRMVRNITGTLIEIARGRYPAEFIEERLKAGPPFQGLCAPAHGLTLVEVEYENHSQY